MQQSHPDVFGKRTQQAGIRLGARVPRRGKAEPVCGYVVGHRSLVQKRASPVGRHPNTRTEFRPIGADLAFARTAPSPRPIRSGHKQARGTPFSVAVWLEAFRFHADEVGSRLYNCVEPGVPTGGPRETSAIFYIDVRRTPRVLEAWQRREQMGAIHEPAERIHRQCRRTLRAGQFAALDFLAAGSLQPTKDMIDSHAGKKLQIDHHLKLHGGAPPHKAGVAVPFLRSQAGCRTLG